MTLLLPIFFLLIILFSAQQIVEWNPIAIEGEAIQYDLESFFLYENTQFVVDKFNYEHFLKYPFELAYQVDFEGQNGLQLSFFESYYTSTLHLYFTVNSVCQLTIIKINSQTQEIKKELINIFDKNINECYLIERFQRGSFILLSQDITTNIYSLHKIHYENSKVSANNIQINEKIIQNHFQIFGQFIDFQFFYLQESYIIICYLYKGVKLQNWFIIGIDKDLKEAHEIQINGFARVPQTTNIIVKKITDSVIFICDKIQGEIHYLIPQKYFKEDKYLEIEQNTFQVRQIIQVQDISAHFFGDNLLRQRLILSCYGLQGEYIEVDWTDESHPIEVFNTKLKVGKTNSIYVKNRKILVLQSCKLHYYSRTYLNKAKYYLLDIQNNDDCTMISDSLDKYIVIYTKKQQYIYIVNSPSVQIQSFNLVKDIQSIKMQVQALSIPQNEKRYLNINATFFKLKENVILRQPFHLLFEKQDLLQDQAEAQILNLPGPLSICPSEYISGPLLEIDNIQQINQQNFQKEENINNKTIQKAIQNLELNYKFDQTNPIIYSQIFQNDNTDLFWLVQFQSLQAELNKIHIIQDQINIILQHKFISLKDKIKDYFVNINYLLLITEQNNVQVLLDYNYKPNEQIITFDDQILKLFAISYGTSLYVVVQFQNNKKINIQQLFYKNNKIYLSNYKNELDLFEYGCKIVQLIQWSIYFPQNIFVKCQEESQLYIFKLFILQENLLQPNFQLINILTTGEENGKIINFKLLRNSVIIITEKSLDQWQLAVLDTNTGNLKFLYKKQLKFREQLDLSLSQDSIFTSSNMLYQVISQNQERILNVIKLHKIGLAALYQSIILQKLEKFMTMTALTLHQPITNKRQDLILINYENLIRAYQINYDECFLLEINQYEKQLQNPFEQLQITIKSKYFQNFQQNDIKYKIVQNISYINSLARIESQRSQIKNIIQISSKSNYPINLDFINFRFFKGAIFSYHLTNCQNDECNDENKALFIKNNLNLNKTIVLKDILKDRFLKEPSKISGYEQFDQAYILYEDFLLFFNYDSNQLNFTILDFQDSITAGQKSKCIKMTQDKFFPDILGIICIENEVRQGQLMLFDLSKKKNQQIYLIPPGHSKFVSRIKLINKFLYLLEVEAAIPSLTVYSIIDEIEELKSIFVLSPQVLHELIQDSNQNSILMNITDFDCSLCDKEEYARDCFRIFFVEKNTGPYVLQVKRSTKTREFYIDYLQRVKLEEIYINLEERVPQLEYIGIQILNTDNRYQFQNNSYTILIITKNYHHLILNVNMKQTNQTETIKILQSLTKLILKYGDFLTIPQFHVSSKYLCTQVYDPFTQQKFYQLYTFTKNKVDLSTVYDNVAISSQQVIEKSQDKSNILLFHVLNMRNQQQAKLFELNGLQLKIYDIYFLPQIIIDRGNLTTRKFQIVARNDFSQSSTEVYIDYYHLNSKGRSAVYFLLIAIIITIIIGLAQFSKKIKKIKLKDTAGYIKTHLLVQSENQSQGQQ